MEQFWAQIWIQRIKNLRIGMVVFLGFSVFEILSACVIIIIIITDYNFCIAIYNYFSIANIIVLSN